MYEHANGEEKNKFIYIVMYTEMYYLIALCIICKWLLTRCIAGDGGVIGEEVLTDIISSKPTKTT